MILISLLPDWIFYVSAFAGLIGSVLVTVFGGLIPAQYKIGLHIIFVLLLVFGVFFVGGISNEADWQLKVKQMETTIAKQELAASEVSNEVITKYIDRVKIVEGKTREIIKKVPVYITKESDDKCIVNNGFVVLHNSSASNDEISRSTGSSNEEPTDVKLSQVATTVSENYGTYYQVAEQLKSLQEWIRKQKDLNYGQ